MANIINLKDVQELDSVVDRNSGLAVVHFWMPWSQPSVQMSEVVDEIAKEHDQVKFVKVEAENFPNICMKYNIAAVPTTIFIRSGKLLDRVDGAHAPELSKKTTKYASVTVVPPLPPPPKEDLNTRLKRLVNSAACLLFMKGTPEEPRCGFSRQMVGLLKEANIQFSTFDILCDDEVRQGLKTFSNWPTYPQLYANGELLGGLDIVKELIASNELQSMLPAQKTITERLKELVNRASVMLFMKGNPQEPRCGFSKQMVAILDEAGVDYDTFDILTDEEVRQNLKTFSNWPSYPQLYVKGDLIGGLDIVKELKENGELQKSLSTES